MAELKLINRKLTKDDIERLPIEKQWDSEGNPTEIVFVDAIRLDRLGELVEFINLQCEQNLERLITLEFFNKMFDEVLE